jgi:aspartate kinase
MQVRSSLKPVCGTVLISDQDSLESQRITGVAGKNNLCLIKLKSKLSVTESMQNLIEENISVEQIGQHMEGEENVLSFSIVKDDEKFVVEKISKKFEHEIIRNLSKVSVAGYGLQSCLDVSKKLFSICEDRQIRVLMLTTSETKVSILLEVDDCSDVIRDVHRAFSLDAN